MLNTILILTAVSSLIILASMGLMFFSKGVRVKGAHARGEQKRYDKAKLELRGQTKRSQ